MTPDSEACDPCNFTIQLMRCYAIGDRDRSCSVEQGAGTDRGFTFDCCTSVLGQIRSLLAGLLPAGDAAVRTWDFSRAQERAEASRAARQARSKARQQRGLRAVWQRQTKPAEAASQADACPDDAVQESAAEAWPSATAGGVAEPDGRLGSHLLATSAQQSEAAPSQGGCSLLDCDAADQAVPGDDDAGLDSMQSGSPAMPCSRQTQSEALTEWQEDSLVSAQRYRPAPGRRRLPRPQGSSVPGPVAPCVQGLEAQHVPGMQTWQIVRPRRTSSSGGSTIPGETSSGITVKVKG